MNFMRSIFAFSLLLIMTYSTSSLAQDTVRIATFNVSMDSSNHLPNDALPNTHESVLPKVLQENNPQIRGIAEIIQRVRPDIILLNEFDYVPRKQGVDVFLSDYLGQSQAHLDPIAYPYVYTAPVNTGSPSAFDLNRDGKATGRGNDAWGFGWYPGQYGMVILSKYPILEDQVRTFQHFLWKDMPGHHVPYVHDENGKPTNEPWYNDETMAQYPLSSKSHWDVPVQVGGKVVHVLAQHPTPPAFDGPENRNGMKNYDEIRFVRDYLTPGADNYIYDDQGQRGGIAANGSFVVLGDLNAQAGASGVEGAMTQLLEHPRVNDVMPMSQGGANHSPDVEGSQYHTAAWRKRVDYVLPSDDLIVKDAGVFWPIQGEPGYDLMKKRDASSDHRLVWLDIELPQ
ncbi:endonuclease/exonuclease/phosphatase family protein [Idiomarina sp.]|uniref:endonuclease/exonuclease/phosphatase family protein n=1 Tax=Idiomarina sp. TaxID=1874361 RepID=UPI0035143259